MSRWRGTPASRRFGATDRRGRLVLLTTKAEHVASTISRFEPDDILLFGKESAGVPADVAAACGRCGAGSRSAPQVRSFNLATSAAHRARRSAAPDRRTARNDPARRPATGRARLVRIAARPICAAFEAIEREAGSDAALRLHPVGPHRGRRHARRRRGARADERQGVREGRGQRLDRRRPLQPRIRRARSPAPRRTRASSPPASAWSRTWPTRTSPRCT